MKLGKLANQILRPFRLRLELLPKDYYNLSLYPEATRPERPKYLNIGSLDFPHPLWHNLDNPTDWDEFSKRQQGNIHVAHDLMSEKPIPVLDNSLSIVYCSHVIEHLRDSDVSLLFREVFRMLAPGGTFRLVAPDMKLSYEAYQRNDSHYFNKGVIIYPAESIEQKLLIQFASSVSTAHEHSTSRKFTDSEVKAVFQEKQMEDFFEHFTSHISLEVQKKFPADHMNWFTTDKAIHLLENAGFEKIWISACDQSLNPLLRNPDLFDPYHEFSFYLECTK